MSTNYDTPEVPASMAEEPAVAYKVRSTRRMAIKPLPVQERILLTEDMKEAVHTAEKSLAEDTCLTEELFQKRFSKWL